jgi:hypothetical protein
MRLTTRLLGACGSTLLEKNNNAGLRAGVVLSSMADRALLQIDESVGS